MSELRDEITAVLNRHSCENKSNTPDYLLAELVLDTLDTFDRIINKREIWHGRKVAR